MDLFTVTTMTPEFRGCQDVTLSWFVVDRSSPVVTYTEAIAGYDAIDKDYRFLAEGAVDEYFTFEEAQALVEYLTREHPGDGHEISRVSLPIEENIMGIGAIPVGGPQGFLMLSKREGWNLPFQVYGYYDLRQHEAAPGGEDEKWKNRSKREGGKP
jgi:hypothetical protein